MNHNKKLTKIELLKCLVGLHELLPIYPEAKNSPLKCVNCGYKKYVGKFNERQYEYALFIATLGDGIKGCK